MFSVNDIHSWIIKTRKGGNIVCETYNSRLVAALNTEKYYAVNAIAHLQGLKVAIRLDERG